jgi:hypothetical protein
MEPSRDRIADDVLTDLLTFSEANGWVRESQVSAHIKSHEGSHTWRDAERVSEAALHAVFVRYVESFLEAYGDVPPHVESAIDDFEDSPSVHLLTEVARAMSAPAG